MLIMLSEHQKCYIISRTTAGVCPNAAARCFTSTCHEDNGLSSARGTLPWSHTRVAGTPSRRRPYGFSLKTASCPFHSRLPLISLALQNSSNLWQVPEGSNDPVLVADEDATRQSRLRGSRGAGTTEGGNRGRNTYDGQMRQGIY